MAEPIPSTMKAVIIREPGGPDVLDIVERAVPKPGPGEVLIKVRAAGVNRPDCLQREGAYPPPPGAPDIPGLEIAGDIVACGDGVTELAPGKAVCALVPGGGYGEYCVAPAGSVLPLPDGYSYVEAAAVPETFFTVWHNVFQRGGLKPGESLLVHGGTSGIGTTAIQLAKAFGSTVYATAGSAEKCEACIRLGATAAIDYREQDFVAEIRTLTARRGVDVILDMVGGDYIDRNYEAAAADGRIVQIAFLGGPKATANFAKLMMKRLTHTGSTLRARDIGFKAALAADLHDEVWPLLSNRTLGPIIDTVVPFSQVRAAHERIEDGGHIGKIVLDMG
jgi:putative PIG3 family NAD(P)H quinone oxidoreductase